MTSNVGLFFFYASVILLREGGKKKKKKGKRIFTADHDCTMGKKISFIQKLHYSDLFRSSSLITWVMIVVTF